MWPSRVVNGRVPYYHTTPTHGLGLTPKGAQQTSKKQTNKTSKINPNTQVVRAAGW